MHRLIGILVIPVLFGCGESTSPARRPAPPDTTISEFTLRVVSTFPHSTNAFTQGLVWDDSLFIEGTGWRNGNSWLRRVRLETNATVQERGVPFPAFGEGVTRLGNRIFQLTWVKGVCFVYDAATMDTLRTFRYATEGWGLTHDGTNLIMSDGTSTLTIRRPDDFSIVRQVRVRDDTGPVELLNELEFIDGRVWANVWHSDVIVLIDPGSGRVRGRLDASALAPLAGIPTPHGDRVLNGIAWDGDRRRLFVTGKLWSRLFEIEPVPVPER